MTIIYCITFLFRALARLQPPAGLIETAMERERERYLLYISSYDNTFNIFTYYLSVFAFGMEVDVAISAAISASWRGSHRP